MRNAALTVHAERRLRQRALPPLVLDLLLDCGDLAHDHHGAEIAYFGKRARRRVEHRIGRQIAARLGDYRDAYAVIANGRVVTAGYRTKRIRKD